MTGPEHYRTAETLLANLRDTLSGSNLPLRGAEQQARMIAEAQVHATLALVAAQVEAVQARGPGDCRTDWVEAVQ